MIKAHEIQGVLALENAFNRVGLDHVLLVRVASTAVATALLGGTRDQVISAVANAWLDGGALRTYRHAPNTGSQIMGRRRRHQPGRSTGAAGVARDGQLSVGTDRPHLGLLRRALQGTAVCHPASVRQLRDGERPFQSLLPGGVPRPDGRRGGREVAPGGVAPAGDNRPHHNRNAGTGRADHRQDRPAGQPGRPGPLPAIHGGRPIDPRHVECRAL